MPILWERISIANYPNLCYYNKEVLMRLSEFDAQMISLKEKIKKSMNKESKKKIQEILSKSSNFSCMEKLKV